MKYLYRLADELRHIVEIEATMATNEKRFRTQDEFLQNPKTSPPRSVRERHPQSVELGIGDHEESLDAEFLSAV
jgi:hypothetical protein